MSGFYQRRAARQKGAAPPGKRCNIVKDVRGVLSVPAQLVVVCHDWNLFVLNKGRCVEKRGNVSGSCISIGP